MPVQLEVVILAAVATSILILLSAIAARTRNPRFHMLFALSAVAYEISFSIRHFGALD